jgi:PAS domain S-box-containing protein
MPGRPTDSRAVLRRLLMAGGTGALAAVAAGRIRRSRRGMSRLRILDQVGRIADGSLTLDETLARVTDAVVPSLADICMVDAIREGDVHRIAVRAEGPDAERIEASIRRRTPSTPDWLRDPGSQSLEPLLVTEMTDDVLRDMAEDEEDLEFLRWLSARSYIVAPLVSRGRRLGALTVVRRRRELGEGDVRFVAALASRVGIALDNAGLFSDLESVERRMDSVMANVAEAVIVHDGKGHLVFANKSASELLGLGGGEDLVSGRPGPAYERFELRDEAGLPLARETLPRRRVLRGEEPEPLVFQLIDHETGLETWRLERSNPIPGPDGGVLYVVTTIEDITAVKQAEFDQRVLASSAEAIASATDFASTLDALAKAVVPELADWCSVSVPTDDGTIERLATSDPNPEMLALEERLRAGLQVRPGLTLSMADVLRASKPVTADLPAEPLPGWVLLKPIRAVGVAIGILTLVNRTGRRAFTSEEIRLARAVADRAGVAVLNAKLATERAKIAETLQRELLPPLLPDVEGWSMAAMYRPAGEHNRAGGDFYDVFEGPDGWVVMLGDVEGHGPEAAALTARARYTIRTAAMINGDIEAAFAILNRQLRARERPRTCSVLCVTFGSGPEATVVSAGHPLPLQVSGGTVREVGLPGSLLGALEEPQWSPVRVSVERGEELVMYTDGVVEARRNGERFGRERLGSLIRRIGDPAATVQRIGDAIDEFGELVSDDAAMVVLRRDREAAFKALQLSPQASEAAE